METKTGDASALNVHLRNGTVKSLAGPNYKLLFPQVQCINDFIRDSAAEVPDEPRTTDHELKQ